MQHQLVSLFEAYCQELLLQAQSAVEKEPQREAALMLYSQVEQIVAKISEVYNPLNDAPSYIANYLSCQIPGETGEQKSDRVAKFVDLAGGATTSIDDDEYSRLRRFKEYTDAPSYMAQQSPGRQFNAMSKIPTVASDTKILFVVVKDSLISGVAFGRLRLALRDLLRQAPMDIVRQEIFPALIPVMRTLMMSISSFTWTSTIT